jgi:hypothetical protein
MFGIGTRYLEAQIMGVATVGIIMFSTLDSIIAFFSITLKQLEPGVITIIRASLQRGECHALKYHVTQLPKEQAFSKSKMYSHPISNHHLST